MIYLVRHGQTVFNAEVRFQGHVDSPLTALGAAQARQVGACLAEIVGRAPGLQMVASPLGRTQRTAGLIAEAIGYGAPIRLDARIAEVSMGSWDGMTELEIDAAFPGARENLSPLDWWLHAPGGETYEGFSSRLAEWLAEAIQEPGPLIAVSHGGASRVLRGLYMGLAKDDALQLQMPQDAVFRFSNGEIERIDCPPPALLQP
jgi:broad specificity phosphatase PhoE